MATLKTIIRQFVGKRFLKRWMVLLIDLALCVLASLITLIFLFYLVIDPQDIAAFEISANGGEIYFSPMVTLTAIQIIVSLILLLIFPIYRGIIRIRSYSGSSRYLWISFLKSGVISLLFGFVAGLWWASLLGFVVDTVFTLLTLIGFRGLIQALWSFVSESDYDSLGGTPTLIFGVNDRSSLLADKLIQKTARKHISLVGFVDPKIKDRVMIGKYKVFRTPSIESVAALLKKYHIELIVFSDYDTLREHKEFVDYCIRKKLRLQVDQEPRSVYSVDSRPPIEDIQIEDILGRQAIFLNMQPIADALKSKVILVTGATGSIGSEIVRQLAALKPKRIVLYDVAETPMHNFRLELRDKYPDGDFVFVMGDVRNAQRVDFVMRRYAPSLVYHAAAYKHVPLMEENPCEACSTNIIGTYTVAKKSIEYGVERVVMLSTDKAVNPSNVMGATKRFCEIIVQSLDLAIKQGKIQAKGHTQFATTRFGNVLGSNGSVIPIFKKQLQQGGPLTVTDRDVVRFFMTIPEASQLVLEAGMLSRGGEIFVFDMGEAVKIDDLARRMIRLAGYEPDVDIQITYTGFRPGEKQYEEVIHNDEKDLPTKHPKIHIVQMREESFERVLPYIKLFYRLSVEGDVEGVVYLLKKVIPEYKSLNSLFAELEDTDRPPFDLEERLQETNQHSFSSMYQSIFD